MPGEAAYRPAVNALRVTVCALLGVAVGPFLEAVVERVPRRQPVLDRDKPWGGVRLPRSARALVVTAAAGALFAATAARFGADWVLPAYLVFAGSMVAVTVIDLEHYLIPNRVVYPTMAAAGPLLVLAAAAGARWEALGRAALCSAAAWALLLVVHVVSPEGMGFGDVRLAAVLGLFLGWLGFGHLFLGIFLGFLLAAVAGVVLMLGGRRTRKQAIPFGPFLAAGALLAVLAGAPLLDWYAG